MEYSKFFNCFLRSLFIAEKALQITHHVVYIDLMLKQKKKNKTKQTETKHKTTPQCLHNLNNNIKEIIVYN